MKGIAVMDPDNMASGLFMLVVSVAVVVALVLASWGIYGAARSNGETDYCYVEVTSPTGMAPQFMLYGHRPFRADRHLGTFKDVDEARVEAKMLECPVK